MQYDALVAKILEENKDSCYYKIKAKYKKSGAWPSYYAAGALAKCRKSKGKKKK